MLVSPFLVYAIERAGNRFRTPDRLASNSNLLPALEHGALQQSDSSLQKSETDEKFDSRLQRKAAHASRRKTTDD